MPERLDPHEILLVEDNESDAELCIDVLKKNHIINDLVWVKDGEEALDYIFCLGAFARRPIANVPRVILLDLRLPKVDGIEVLKRIRSDQRTKNIPVVILTSSTEDHDLVESYDSGANGYTSKPVEFHAFTEAVVRLGLYWLLTNRPPL